MLKKHSSCKDKLYIPDFIRNNIKTTNSNDVEKQLERRAQSLKRFQETYIKAKEDLKGKKDKVLKEIVTFREMINQLLDKFEKSIVLELEQKYKSLTDNIDSSCRKLEATTNEIKASQDSLKFAAGNMPQKFVSIKQANRVLSESEGLCRRSLESQFSYTQIEFFASKKLQKLFSEIQDLGSIRVRENVEDDDRQKYPVNVKSDSDTCYITSACTLNDGSIILADGINSKLKCLDSLTYIVTDYCDVPLLPCQVCAITDTEVAVLCYNSALIQFVTVDWTKKKTRQIKTGFPCQSLAYADERLFVSDDTSVYMFSLSGEKLRQLYKDQSAQGRSQGVQTLAINTDMSRIFVAHSGKGLLILDVNGKLVGQYIGFRLNGANCVCRDNNGNMLAYGLNSKNVLKFSPDGKYMKAVLISDEIFTAVCCNKNNSQLIVGRLIKDEIKVYDINLNA